MNTRLLLKTPEITSFAKLLVQNHNGRMQYRDGHKEELQAFCIVNVAPGNASNLQGHLAGPHGNNVTFSVSFGASGNHVISLKPEGNKGYNADKALKDVTAALEIMIARVAAQKKMGKMSTKNWKGFYLRNTGKKGVGKTGMKNFDEAIKAGIISSEFKTSCVAVGFLMLKFD